MKYQTSHVYASCISATHVPDGWPVLLLATLIWAAHSPPQRVNVQEHAGPLLLEVSPPTAPHPAHASTWGQHSEGHCYPHRLLSASVGHSSASCSPAHPVSLLLLHDPSAACCPCGCLVKSWDFTSLGVVLPVTQSNESKSV